MIIEFTTKRPYLRRNEKLRRMGIAVNYQAYLRSPAWAEHRLKVLRRDRFKCQGCGEKATEVHHFKYTRKTLAGKATFWMVSICRTCHHFIEFYVDGTKVTLANTKGRLMQLRVQNGLTTSTSRFLQNIAHKTGQQRPPIRSGTARQPRPTGTAKVASESKPHPTREGASGVAVLQGCLRDTPSFGTRPKGAGLDVKMPTRAPSN